ncbi:hypothetical protein FRB98_000970 [Tulasnella sp. 332]|nr:hypothetical protein FRB98_000970 [Tulasnella sp. 332]
MLVQLLAISAFVASGTTLASAASLSSLHSIWDDTWAEDWYTQYYVAGNGPLGIAVSSNPANDEVVLNLDTLWQGGPFSPYVRGMDFFSQQQTLLNNINVTQNNYTGGNPTEPLDPSILKGIRKEIMTNGNASVAALQTGYDGYGSYSTPGSFFVSRVGNATVSNYKRSTLFQEGKIQATWTEGKVNLQREYYCSYPTTSCHIHTNSTGGKAPATVNSFFTARPPSASNITCLSSSSLLYTSSADPTITEGMQFSFIAKVTVTGATTTCSSSTGAISISAGATDVFWSIVGDTQYDINKGTRETGYTFSNGKDTAAVAKTLIATVDALSASQIAAKHASDWSALYSGFELVLGDISEISDTKTTNASIEAFTWEKGDLLLENNVFNYGRYLLISCARGTLPASLQGVWSIYTYDDTISGYDLGAPWGSDFHADINLQQNYWGAESTNLGSLTTTLWDLVQKTWIPRGTETAALLYNSSGWVVHDEMNPFGHTAMKGGFDVASEWSDFQVAGTWILAQAFDHFDYASDSTFWKMRGYSLLKSNAQFWLENLFPNEFSSTSALVVAPCNSPEQPLLVPGSLDCTIFQHTISDLFRFILRGAAIAGETDQAFLANVANKLANMDKGAHIGSWGQLQEWGALDIDEPTDHHRHISHLYGMYPGTSLAAWNASSPSKSEIYSAVATSLQARGNGTDDSNTGWGKMHRAAVAATLGNATYSHNLYKYAIQENIVGNLFDHLGSIFQIEANLAAPGVVLQMLLQSHSSLSPQVVTLLPALPAAWSTGSISGARLRGGLGVSMTWANGKVTSGTITYDRGGPAARVVEVYEAGVLKKMGTLAFGESWSLV